MTTETGQPQVLNPEMTSVYSSEIYLKNLENIILMKQPIKYLFQSQKNLKKMEYIVQLPLNPKTL
jgi:hypothetical protein